MKHKVLSVCLSLLLMLGLMVPGTAADLSAEEIPMAGGYDDPMYWRETHWDEWNAMQDGAEENGVTAGNKAAAKLLSYGDFKPRALKETEILRRGIDVSEYQGNIDWSEVAESGVEFAIIRVGARGWGDKGTLLQDSSFRKNIEGARENGILVGAYIFSQAITEEEGREEAQHLLKLLDGCEMDLPLVLDYEYATVNGGSGGRLYDAKLSKDEAAAVCDAFCEEVEAAGYESMVYANPTMLKNQLHPERIKRLWLAHYTSETNYAGDYEYWQCTSSGGIPGISKRVDLNFWFEPDGVAVTLPFEDVLVGQWCYENVKEAYQDGIVNGITPERFGPDEQIARCQMVTMLYRMEGSPEVSGSTGFTDLTDQYYQDAVLWAWQNGIIRGYSETSFAPYDSMVREDLMLLLYRKAGEPETTASLEEFPDGDKVSAYAQKAVAWAVENELIHGYTDGTIRPRGTTTRAEACTLLMRYRRLAAEQEKPPETEPNQ